MTNRKIILSIFVLLIQFVSWAQNPIAEGNKMYKSMQFDMDTDPTASTKESLPHLKKKKGGRYNYRNRKIIDSRLVGRLLNI